MHIRLPLLVLLALLAVPVAAQPHRETIAPPSPDPESVNDLIPAVIYMDQEGYDAPVWVSAEASETSNGSVAWDLLGEKAHRAYRYLNETQTRLRELYGKRLPSREGQFCPEDPHYVRYEEVHVDLRHPPTLSDLDLYLGEQTSRVVLARVVDRANGFFESIPGTLLALEPQRTYKGQADADSLLYLHYPVAKFKVGSVGFCKQHEGLPDQVRVGEAILFFVHDGPLPTEPPVYASWHGEIAVFSGGEAEYLPAFLHGKLGLSPGKDLQEKPERASVVLEGLDAWFKAHQPTEEVEP